MRCACTGTSKYQPPHRSPHSIALLKDVVVGDFELTVRVQETNVTAGPHRDLCIFWGYQDPSHFYYVHFGAKADPHACQIFIVNDAPRTMITVDQAKGTPWTEGWHTVKVVRRVEDGTMKVYFDDMEKPLMTAKRQDVHLGPGRPRHVRRSRQLRRLRAARRARRKGKLNHEDAKDSRMLNRRTQRSRDEHIVDVGSICPTVSSVSSCPCAFVVQEFSVTMIRANSMTISRRQFLGTSAAATAAVWSASWTKSVFAQDTADIRIAVIGFNGQGQRAHRGVAPQHRRAVRRG